MSESKAKLLKERDEWQALFFLQAKRSEDLSDAMHTIEDAIDAIDGGDVPLARRILVSGTGGGK